MKPAKLLLAVVTLALVMACSESREDEPDTVELRAKSFEEATEAALAGRGHATEAAAENEDGTIQDLTDATEEKAAEQEQDLMDEPGQ